MPRVEVFNRELVLDQMMDVFHNNGYNGTSMQDLVDATQLNRSSIYNSFGNKLAIFMECLRVYQEQHKRLTSRILLEATNSLEAIEGIFDLYVSIIANDKDKKGCMLSNCSSEMANQEEQIIRFLESHQNNMMSFFMDLVDKGQQNGVINKQQSSSDYALYLLSSLQGLRSTGILSNNKKELSRIAKIMLDTLK